MRIQHNIPAMNAYRSLKANNSALSKNLEKLSSGYKVNRAGDDAAGLAISEKMRAQITGLQGAQRNAKDGISLVQTAEGALQEVHDMLNRMYSLAEQSANGTYDVKLDRQQMQKEVEAIRSEIDRIADSANFNGIQLLDGNMSSAKVGTVSGTDAVDFEAGIAAVAAFSFTSSMIRTVVMKTLSLAGVQAKVVDGTNTITSFSTDNAAFDAWVNQLWETQFKNRSIGLGNTNVWQDITVTLHASAPVYQIAGVDFTNLGITASSFAADYSFSGSASAFAYATDAVGATPVPSYIRFHVNKTAILGANVIASHEKYNLTFQGTTVTLKSTDSPHDLEALVKEWMSVHSATLSFSGWSVAWNSADPLKMTFTATDVGRKRSGPFIGCVLTNPGKDEIAAQTATPAKTTIDFTGKSALDMQDVQIQVKFTDTGGSVQTHIYEFTNSSRGNLSGGGSTTKVYIPANAVASDIANALNSALAQDLDGYTASVSQGQVIIKSDTLGSAAKAAQATILNGGLRLLVGDTAESFNYINIGIDDVHCKAMDVETLDISTQNGAASALDKIKTAINYVSNIRGGLGAIQNRLDHTINNLSVMEENIQDAESTIRDTDVAEEMMKYTKNNILNQAAQAMLAQANQSPQSVLQLLQ